MNLNVNPCDDFYEYTCGHWTEEHPNHGWYPKFSSFSTIGERVAINVLNFLKTNATEMEPVPVQQTRDFYKSCMDQGNLLTLTLFIITTIIIKKY